MVSAAELSDAVSRVLDASWSSRDGQVVPETKDVVLANGAVKLNAAFLYADLFDSTAMVRDLGQPVTAKIVRAYLALMSRLIKANGGDVRSFDGDRVMGVFVGSLMNTNAVKCGLQMKHAVDNVLRPAAERRFPSLKASGHVIRHCAGIDHGESLVVRAGVRDANDLSFIGTAPNYAAKLSGTRDGIWNTYITKPVYERMAATSKFKEGVSTGTNMWTQVVVTIARRPVSCYKSFFTWPVR